MKIWISILFVKILLLSTKIFLNSVTFHISDSVGNKKHFFSTWNTSEASHVQHRHHSPSFHFIRNVYICIIYVPKHLWLFYNVPPWANKLSLSFQKLVHRPQTVMKDPNSHPSGLRLIFAHRLWWSTWNNTSGARVHPGTNRKTSTGRKTTRKQSFCVGLLLLFSIS